MVRVKDRGGSLRIWFVILAAALLGLSAPVMVALSTSRAAMAADSTPISTNQRTAPAATPVISRNVPAHTNDDCGGSQPAGNANDNDYDSQWWACRTPTNVAPIYLAYDLSGVPAAKRGQVLALWYNDPQTMQYDHTYVGVHPCCTWPAYDIPSAYTLQANAASGGSLPALGWVTLAIVTGNVLHSRQHLINLSGYNWFRINITKSEGSNNNFGIILNLDIHDASAGPQDDWIFYGDSITEGAMPHGSYSWVGGTGTWAQLINAAEPGHFPAYEAAAIGGTLSADGVRSINGWLSLFPGRYAGVAYGTNDAGWGVSPATFYDNYVTMVEAVLAAGKVPIVPKIPWGCTSDILANVPALNQKIEALYAAYPQIIKGPDLWSYFKANQGLISDDCVHPSDAGYFGMRQQWANAMVANVYTAAPAVSLGLTVPTSAQAGQAFNVTVTLKDGSGNVATGYTGTVRFTSTDALAILPASYTFTGADAGAHTFSVTLLTPSNQTITVADVADAGLTATSPPIRVHGPLP
jgi:lysophospholipase L1-like esterase